MTERDRGIFFALPLLAASSAVSLFTFFACLSAQGSPKLLAADSFTLQLSALLDDATSRSLPSRNVTEVRRTPRMITEALVRTQAIDMAAPAPTTNPNLRLASLDA